MDKSAVRQVVDANIKEMSNRLYLSDWHIDVCYGSQSDGQNWEAVVGWVKILPDYKRATISLDPECLDTEEDVLRILRHELLHILLADWEVYADVMWQAVCDDPVKGPMAARIKSMAGERCVFMLEQMLNWGLRIGYDLKPKAPADDAA